MDGHEVGTKVQPNAGDIAKLEERVRWLESTLVQLAANEAGQQTRHRARQAAVRRWAVAVCAVAIGGHPLVAQSYDPVPHTYSSNTAISSAEVNENFAHIIASLNDLEQRVAALPEDRVIAAYRTNSGQSISGSGGTRVDYSEEIIDTHASVSPGVDWTFTAPTAGAYYLAASVSYDQATDGGYSVLEVRDDADVLMLSGWASAATHPTIAAHTIAVGVLVLEAGQQLHVQADHNSPTLTLANSFECQFVAIQLNALP